MTTLFLCGDVMLGRGVDQRLPHSVDPGLRETFVRDARRYVELAESVSGPIPRELGFDYVWGDALEELDAADPELELVNLETAVTADGEPWPGKGIHYRMHPGNVPVLKAAGIDGCVLANNHALDWGHEGLARTLDVLAEAEIETVGAGRDREEAWRGVGFERAGRTIRVFAFGLPSAGVPRGWAAAEDRPGVAYLPDVSGSDADRAVARVREESGADDVVVVSLHWGGNWGYEVGDRERAFARRLVDEAGADVIHGHSSHHPKGVELYRGRPILYGCGDFLNDYEGISGHEEYRPELAAMYLVEVGREPPHGLTLVTMRIRRFRLERATEEDAEWLARTVERESRQLDGPRVELGEDGRIRVRTGAG